MRTRQARVVALLCAGMLVACGTQPQGTETPDASVVEPPTRSPARTASPTLSPSNESTEELERLLRSLENTHPNPFHGIERAAFVAAFDGYVERLPELAPEEAVVELMRVWALLSRQGRDGHQFALPVATVDDPMLPLRVYEFDEGVYVTDALPPHGDLVGGRIVGIGEHDIEHVLDDVEPLVPRDGPGTVQAHRPILLLRTIVLRGLGLIEDGPVDLRLVSGDGTIRTVAVDPVSADEYGAWAGPFGIYQLPLDPSNRYLSADEPFGVERMGVDDALYLRYRFVSVPSTDRAREALDAGAVRRLILDLRQNPGGDNGTYRRLLEFVQSWATEHPGTTFVLTDRVTFSAAANLATEIEQTTDAVFVGEPMGGSPNLYADVTWVTLRSLPIPMRVAVSTVHWEMSASDDPRLTIEPDLPLPVTAADHFAHRDPALDAALTAPLGEGVDGG